MLHLHFPLLLTAHESCSTYRFVVCDPTNIAATQFFICRSMHFNECKFMLTNSFEIEVNSRPSETFINIPMFVLTKKRAIYHMKVSVCMLEESMANKPKKNPTYRIESGEMVAALFFCRHDPKRNANQKLCTRMKWMPSGHSYVASRFEYTTEKKQ